LNFAASIHGLMNHMANLFLQCEIVLAVAQAGRPGEVARSGRLLGYRRPKAAQPVPS